jgi:DNA-binding NarL/FixJ family response regulator
MKTAHVPLADDHALVRGGIRSLLEKMTGIEVVAEASDGREALELTKKHLPNVVLMDTAMAGLNGLEALARAMKEFSSVKFFRCTPTRSTCCRRLERGRAATFSRMRWWPNWSWPSGP